MKTKFNLKAWIKQGFYERSAKDLRGALNFQQEVLDSLVREEILTTTDCCTYYHKIPVVSTEEEISNLPDNVLFLFSDGEVPILGINYNGSSYEL